MFLTIKDFGLRKEYPLKLFARRSSKFSLECVFDLSLKRAALYKSDMDEFIAEVPLLDLTFVVFGLALTTTELIGSIILYINYKYSKN